MNKNLKGSQIPKDKTIVNIKDRFKKYLQNYKRRRIKIQSLQLIMKKKTKYLKRNMEKVSKKLNNQKHNSHL